MPTCFKPWPAAAFLTFFGWLIPAVCLSTECLSPSPTLSAGKNPYAAIVKRDLTPDEQKTVERVLRSLTGNWTGRTETFFCSSAVDPRDVLGDRETLQAKVTVDYDGNWTLAADFFSPQSKSSRQELLTLYHHRSRLRIDHDTGMGDVELIGITDTKIAFLYRRLVPLGRSGSSRREHFFTLLAGENGFTIERLLYVQGKLSSGQTWFFKR